MFESMSESFEYEYTVSGHLVGKNDILKSLESTISLLKKDIKFEEEMITDIEFFLKENFGKDCIPQNSPLRSLNILKVNIQVPEEYNQYVDSSHIAKLTYFFKVEFDIFFSSNGYKLDFRHSANAYFADISNEQNSVVSVMF